MLQGDSSGPDIWTALSSIIFDILHTKVFDNTMSSIISKQLFILVGFAYFDDCNLFQVGEYPIDVLNLMKK